MSSSLDAPFRDCCSLKNVLTLICSSLAAILSGEIIVDFLVTKPTTTSERQVNFQSSDFPDVLICVDPGIDSLSAKKYGYKSEAFYWQGRSGDWEDGKFIGWNGKDGKQTSSDVLEELLTVKSDERYVTTFWHLNKSWKNETTEGEFRILRCPYWRCQLIKPSKIKSINKNTSFISMTSAFPEVRNESSMSVLLLDPKNSPLTYPLNFQMRGHHIRVPFEKGWRIFKIKVLRSEHVQGDPNFECTKYDEDNTYGDCVQKEMRNIIVDALNCTPPQMMIQEYPDDHVCNQRFDMNVEEGNELRDFFEILFDFKPSACKRPCTQTTYEVQSTQEVEYPHSSIGLNFESVVDVTQAEFRTTFATLLTGLGGSVSRT